MVDERRTASPQRVGLSIEPGDQSSQVLVLKLGTSRFECVLELDDPGFAVDGDSGYLGPVYTLDCWISELERLSAGGGPVVLLPFNFSDQCTGWLRVALVHERVVEVQAGWSEVGQYELGTPDPIIASGRIRDFEPVSNARIVRPLADIVAAVVAVR